MAKKKLATYLKNRSQAELNAQRERLKTAMEAELIRQVKVLLTEQNVECEHLTLVEAMKTMR